MRWKALVIAIPEPEGDEYDSLADFAVYADEVAEGLRGLGYEVAEQVQKTWNWTAEKINQEVRMLVDEAGSDDVRVVHILGHGVRNERLETIFPVGSDGKTHLDGRFDEWIARLEASEGTCPMTLFILDTCYSGAAARPHWGKNVNAEDLRGWVLAASEPNRAAYDANLSRAVAKQLSAVANNTMGISPDEEFVKWEIFRNKVIDDVEKYGGGARSLSINGAFRQRVTSTALDRNAPNLPFYPNPYFVTPGPLKRAKTDADPGLGPFLDSAIENVVPTESIHGLDQDHFVERARGRGAPEFGGAFTGRRSQLVELSSWIDGSNMGDSVRVVTGSPGAGKSAVLGILVCAAHPFLRERTAEVWSRAAKAPGLQPNMVGIHARSMSIPQILKSIHRQLDLPDGDELLTVETLTAALLQQDQEQFLLVLDAVDEAENVSGCIGLIRHLAETCWPDGTSVCRLLVGTRAGHLWPDIENWVNQLPDSQRTNLDAVPSVILEEDLRIYLTTVLSPGPFTQRIAAEIARGLTRERGTTRGWGEFLVASLVAAYIDRQGIPISEAATEQLLTKVPRTLPELLDLDLSFGEGAILQRAILTCLAWSKGAGMPLRLLRLLAISVFAPGATVSDQDFNVALDHVRFYLRSSTDVTGELLWRPFHQGITDHLRTGGLETARAILSVILDDRPIDARGGRQWSAAEPYLTRHALGHAIDANRAISILDDADYLVHADPGYLATGINELDHADNGEQSAGDQRQETIAAIYRQSLHRHRQLEPRGRRQVLQVDRARFRANGVLVGLLHDSATSPAIWNVNWATGATITNQLWATLQAGPASIVTCTMLPEGSPFAITATDWGSVRVWDLTSHTPTGEPLIGQVGPVTAMGCWMLTTGVPILVTTSVNGILQVWDLTSRTLMGAVLSQHYGPILSVGCLTLPNGTPVAVTTGQDGTVRLFDISGYRTIGEPLRAHFGPVLALSCMTMSDGTPVAVTSGLDGTLRVWDLARNCKLGKPLRGHAGRVLAVGCATLPNGTPVAVTGDLDGTVRVWDLARHCLLEDPLRGHKAAVVEVTCMTLKCGTLVAVTGDADGTVRVWDLASHSPLGEFLHGQDGKVRAVGFTKLSDGRPVAVTAGENGSVRVWKLTKVQPLNEPLRGHVGLIRGIACASLPEIGPIGITVGDDGTTRVWDLAGETALREPLLGHKGKILAVACTDLSDEGPVAITAGDDGTVRIWDLTIHAPLNTDSRRWHKMPVRAVACTTLTGTGPIAIVAKDEPSSARHGRHGAVAEAGSRHQSLQLWDLTKKRPLRDPMHGRTGKVSAVACITDPGSVPLAVTAGKDGAVRIWNLATNRQLGKTLREHTGEVYAVGCTTLPAGLPIAVTGGADGIVRFWDLTTQSQRGESDSMHVGAVLAVAFMRTKALGSIVVTGGEDCLIRVWNLEDSSEIYAARFELPDIPQTIAVENDLLVIGMAGDLVILSIL